MSKRSEDINTDLESIVAEKVEREDYSSPLMIMANEIQELKLALKNKDRDCKIQSIGLISGRSTLHLASEISEILDIPLTPCNNKTFANGEIKVEINTSIRNKDMFILQTGASDKNHTINDYIMELFQLIKACKLSGAKSITTIIPCFPYARSDKKDAPRCAIGSATIAEILEMFGVKRITSMDLHAGQIQGFARGIPFDNLYGINLLTNELRTRYFKDMSTDDINKHYVLISPDAGGVKRCEAYARLLKMDYVIMHKQRDYTKESVVLNSKLIGDPEKIKGKTGIIIDDIADTFGTMISTINTLTVYIEKMIVVVTHGILSGPAVKHINDCKSIINVVVIDTIDQTNHKEQCNKLIVVKSAELFADVIKRLRLNESISELFPQH